MWLLLMKTTSMDSLKRSVFWLDLHSPQSSLITSPFPLWACNPLDSYAEAEDSCNNFYVCVLYEKRMIQPMWSIIFLPV